MWRAFAQISAKLFPSADFGSTERTHTSNWPMWNHSGEELIRRYLPSFPTFFFLAWALCLRIPGRSHVKASLRYFSLSSHAVIMTQWQKNNDPDWGVGGFAFLDSKRLVSSSSNFLFMRLQLDCCDNFSVTPAENDQGVYEVFRVKPPEVAYLLGETVLVSQDLMCYLTFPSLPWRSVGTIWLDLAMIRSIMNHF